MSLKGAEDFFDTVSKANEDFWWGDIVENIGIDWDFQGKTELAKAETAKELFDNMSSLTFEQVKDATKMRWSNGYTNVIMVDDLDKAMHQNHLMYIQLLVGKKGIPP